MKFDMNEYVNNVIDWQLLDYREIKAMSQAEKLALARSIRNQTRTNYNEIKKRNSEMEIRRRSELDEFLSDEGRKYARESAKKAEEGKLSKNWEEGITQDIMRGIQIISRQSLNPDNADALKKADLKRFNLPENDEGEETLRKIMSLNYYNYYSYKYYDEVGKITEYDLWAATSNPSDVETVFEKTEERNTTQNIAELFKEMVEDEVFMQEHNITIADIMKLVEPKKKPKKRKTKRK